MRTRRRTIGKQYKRLSFDVKAFELGSRKISGYAAIFGVKDKADDILIKGCFAKSIAERGPESDANDKIILLWMHDMREPIGRITKLIEDDKGLYFEADIDDIPLGDRAIKQMESGTINQFSIGYSYVWDKTEYDDKMDAYIVREVLLYEISPVSIGCNGLTEYTGLKSDEDIEDRIARLSDDIDNELSSMSVAKKSRMQELFGKVWSLASVEPGICKILSNDNPLDDKGAGHTRKSIFDIRFN